MNAKHIGPIFLLLAAAIPAVAQDVPGVAVAGLAPYARPAQAPRMTAPVPLDKARALRGVSEPVPASLKFLDDQGGWYNPFTHPGMLPPYDPRGWHARPAPNAK